jgi:hypothetical protein
MNGLLLSRAFPGAGDHLRTSVLKFRAAKLVISTLADVRHTMFMSGLTPFPREHWGVLSPAMQQQTSLHQALTGHRPRGPFKHHWGMAQRLVGDDQLFSLWLAAGVPFEIVERPPSDGWTFLSDFDARELALASRVDSATPRWVCRSSAMAHPPGAEMLGESLLELFAFKHRIRDQLQDVPHVEEDHPAVCAWYPSAGRVTVWNLASQARDLTVVDGAHRQVLRLGPLGAGSTVVTQKTK